MMNIFVGCSSRDVTDNVKWSRYCTATLEVTKFITAHKHTLVFGGCARGLMGLMYKCILLNKANIIVAIPQAYINDAEELFYSNLFDFNTVSERKDWIFKNTSKIVFFGKRQFRTVACKSEAYCHVSTALRQSKCKFIIT